MSEASMNAEMRVPDPKLETTVDPVEKPPKSNDSIDENKIREKIADLRRQWSESLEKNREYKGSWDMATSINNNYSRKIADLESKLTSTKDTPTT